MIKQSLLALALFGAWQLFGCSSSTTTTREDEDGKRLGVVQEDDEFRFVTKIKREQAREDDKKVNRKALTSNRSVREEILPDGLNRDAFLLEVVSYLGVRYSYGGNNKKGMDCSGFTCSVFMSGANTLLPRSTTEQFRVGEKIDKGELQFGDLVFFNTTGRSPSHVGIYIEDDIFAHASVIEGVTLSSLESTYYKKRYIGARRVID